MNIALLPGARRLVRKGIIDPDDLQPLAEKAIEKWRAKGGGAWAASHHIERSDGGSKCVAVMAVSGWPNSDKPECFALNTEDEPAYRTRLDQVVRVAKQTKGYKDKPDGFLCWIALTHLAGNGKAAMKMIEK